MRSQWNSLPFHVVSWSGSGPTTLAVASERGPRACHHLDRRLHESVSPAGSSSHRLHARECPTWRLAPRLLVTVPSHTRCLLILSSCLCLTSATPIPRWALDGSPRHATRCADHRPRAGIGPLHCGTRSILYVSRGSARPGVDPAAAVQRNRRALVFSFWAARLLHHHGDDDVITGACSLSWPLRSFSAHWQRSLASFLVTCH